jgi:hypothetical protein
MSKNAKIRAFNDLNRRGLVERAYKAGVFKAAEGIIPTCTCDLDRYQDHAYWCQQEMLEEGYKTYMRFAGRPLGVQTPRVGTGRAVHAQKNVDIWAELDAHERAEEERARIYGEFMDCLEHYIGEMGYETVVAAVAQADPVRVSPVLARLMENKQKLQYERQT